MTTLNLAGRSGQSLLFQEYGLTGTTWNDVAGFYAFLVRSVGSTRVLYIGECVSFKTRPMPPGHERWAEASRLGCNMIVACAFNGTEAQRKAIEKDLIANYDPPMNTQHRSSSVA